VRKACISSRLIFHNAPPAPPPEAPSQSREIKTCEGCGRLFVRIPKSQSNPRPQRDCDECIANPPVEDENAGVVYRSYRVIGVKFKG